MDTGMRTYGDELVAVLSAATAALSDLPTRVHQLTGSDLHMVLPVVDRLAAVAAAGRFTLTADAVDRGEVAGSQAGSPRPVGRRPVPVPGRPRRRPGRQSRPGAHRPVGRRAHVGVGVGGRSGGGAGGSVVGARELRGRVRAAAADPADRPGRGRRRRRRPGRHRGGRRCRRGPRVRPALLARYGLGMRLQEIEDRHRGLTVLSCGHDIGGGITEYRMRLNPEARAVVEAAINTLSAKPAVVDGEPRPPHHRPTPRRRPRPCLPPRSCTHPDDGHTVRDQGHRHRHHRPGRPARPDPARRPGRGIDAGTLLGPETVRRLACDGCVIPAVLAPDGHILHWGRGRGTSPPPKPGPCGCETGTAPSPAATPPPPGATPTTYGTGSTADPPT